MHIILCLSESFGSRMQSREGGLEGDIGIFLKWAREGLFVLSFSLLSSNSSCLWIKLLHSLELFLLLNWLCVLSIPLLAASCISSYCALKTRWFSGQVYCWEQMGVLLTSTRSFVCLSRQSGSPLVWQACLGDAWQTACWHVCKVLVGHFFF